MNEELKTMCDRLTMQEKVELRNYLTSGIAPNDAVYSKTPLRCEMLLGDIAAVMGVDYIPTTCRIPSYVWARVMVAYQMVLEGYGKSEIGRQMCKDHSTIIYMTKKMEDVFSLPEAYGDILDLWDKFQKRIKT